MPRSTTTVASENSTWVRRADRTRPVRLAGGEETEHEIGDEERCPRDGHHQRNSESSQSPSARRSRVANPRPKPEPANPVAGSETNSKLSEVDRLLATCERFPLAAMRRMVAACVRDGPGVSYQTPLTEKLKIWTLSP